MVTKPVKSWSSMLSSMLKFEYMNYGQVTLSRPSTRQRMVSLGSSPSVGMVEVRNFYQNIFCT